MARPHALIERIEAHETPLARLASDHLPVKATVRLGGVPVQPTVAEATVAATRRRPLLSRLLRREAVPMTLRLAALAAAALLALPGGAQALAFSLADLNHDGVVTWPEARRVFPRLAEVHFRKCDPNGDGLIDPGRVSAAQQLLLDDLRGGLRPGRSPACRGGAKRR